MSILDRPARGIGPKAVDTLLAKAEEHKMGIIEFIMSEHVSELTPALRNNVTIFSKIYGKLIDPQITMTFPDMIDFLLQETGYVEWINSLKNNESHKRNLTILSGVVEEVNDMEIVVKLDKEQTDDYVRLEKTDDKLQKIKDAGIVGVGGAGFPTGIKLSAQIPGGYVIANAAVEGNGGVEGFVDSEENSEASVNEEFSEEITEEIFEEVFENGIFLDEEPEYTSIWRYEKRGKRRYFIEIDLFIKQAEKSKNSDLLNGNLFRKYNEQHYKYIYEPEWIVKTKDVIDFYDSIIRSI